MILNALEKALVNSAARVALQRRLVARQWLAMGGPTPGAAALEIGCGRGAGVELALDLFGAARVDALDQDPGMVELARRRLAARGDRVQVRVGDAERLDAPDASYDAVFDFAILHHVVDWRRAVGEIARVLRPGGRFYAEEFLRDFIRLPLVRSLLEHPMVDRFDASQLSGALEGAGLRVTAQRQVLGQVVWLVAIKPAP